MGCERRLLAAALALCVSGSGSLAIGLAQPAPVVSPAPAPDPISAALCGHGKGSFAALANALDAFDARSLPPLWQSVEVEKLKRWREAPVCPKASAEEAQRYRSRHAALEQLGRRVDRTAVLEGIGIALVPFRGRRLIPAAWPSSSECPACASLRVSAERVADIAGRWKPGTGTTLGAQLADGVKRESLIHELCAAAPSRGARAEIERRFLYYSWTASAEQLFDVAGLFEQPGLAAECRPR